MPYCRPDCQTLRFLTDTQCRMSINVLSQSPMYFLEHGFVLRGKVKSLLKISSGAKFVETRTPSNTIRDKTGFKMCKN